MSLEYWYLFPISVGVATLAMASGIGGAVFFSPIFLLWLKLEPTVAIGTALITEFFGFSSGLIAYARSGLIDYRLGAQLLVFAVPGAIAGVIFGDLIPPIVLKTIFAVGLVFIGLQLFLSWRQEQKAAMDAVIEQEAQEGFASRIYGFVEEGKDVLDEALSVTMFTVPGVLIGGQLGPKAQSRVNPDTMKVVISWLFMGVGTLMLITLIS